MELHGAVYIHGACQLIAIPLHAASCLQRGWQWLFIAEGAPTVALGIATVLLLPGSLHQAGFLEPSEKRWLSMKVGTWLPATWRTAHGVDAGI